MYLYSHNLHSEGAKALAKALGIKRIKHNTGFAPDFRTPIINWGSSQPAAKLGRHKYWINRPDAIGLVANKLSFFQKMEGSKLCPWFTTDKEKAADQIAKGHIIVCRQILNGSGGKGIVLARQREDLVDAPLYTRYINKKSEYRIHVGYKEIPDGPGQAAGVYEIIDMQEKARKNGIPDDQVNWQVRNHANGFIYKRQGIVVPEVIKKAAVDCMATLGCLDFGAVDVVYNAKNDKAAVLEVNSAPGLEGQTVESYAKYFRENWL